MQTSQSNPSGGSGQGSLFDGVTLYHWLVVLIASCGWLFDCMDQRLFILAREPALKELLGIHAATAANDPALLQSIATHAKSLGGWATACMMLGWAVGGIFFGMLSDRWGRVKTMAATLMVYSCFTGLSGIAHSPTEFLTYRFLVGLGVGGMFGAATTLVAESVPGRMRAIALGSLQALSATGNIMGSIISTQIPPSAVNLVGDYSGWRLLFFVGIIPAILVIPILFILREPEPWKQAKAAAATGAKRNVGSLADLFRDPRWRHNSIIGLCLGVSGMIGLWGIGFFSPELISEALKGAPQPTVDFVRSWGTALQDVGAFTGMIVFTFVASFVSRRTAFLGSFILCWIVVAFVFYSLKTATDAYWMLPMMGFATLSVFAGYSIYFPELFPTRLRGTGVGFCYNTVRFLTAPAPALFGYLTTVIPFRTTAIIMSSIYVLGIVALIWAPETKGQPLPED